MTRIEKELLVTDLIGRLNYEPYIKIEGCAAVFLTCIYYEYEDYGVKNYYVNNGYDISRVKPYLFPLTSMTDEQREEEKHLKEELYSFDANGNMFTLQDFYNKYHIDYRGLIPRGLAIDATNYIY